MNILISNSSSMPIYEQIKKQIIDQIIDGSLNENDMLPSIRSLSKDIKISVMTIKKAYDELEAEGYIISRQGKGSYVAPKNMDLILEQAKQEIEEHIESAIDIATKHGISKEELKDIFEFMISTE